MKRISIIFLIVALVGIIGYFLYFRPHSSSKKEVARPVTTTNKDNSLDALVIPPQIPQGKVVVQSATLSKNGFVVVRQIDDGKLSQIIEMSKPLSPGTHKDVTISLGNADITKGELIVMLYDDYANDGIFNDFDQPTINKDGFMTAKYVMTGKPIPSDIAEADTGTQGMNMPGMKGMQKITYTDKGFIPEKIEVPVGTMVEFINESSTVMWVASTPHPQHTDLPTFDQFKTVGKGGRYRYVFDKKGKWGFHDHINASRGGVITVQ